MNYFALAGGLVCAVIVIMALSTIVRVAVGAAHWNSWYAFYAQAAYVAGFGTLAVWLFGIVPA